jgi:SAM-dependent methyltransferase
VSRGEPYYGSDLALVHHLGFGFHADVCAPGILGLLAPVRDRDGLVLEFGCGSGLLTEKLVVAGHRVVATDASPAMLEIARDHVSDDVVELRRLTLPDDPVPKADAIVGIGHPINYLPDAESIDRAILALGQALRPGGVLAFDVCDLEYGQLRQNAPNVGWVDAEWALVTQFSTPSPDRFVRDMVTFMPNADGSWRRGNERHDNVLIEVDRVPELLRDCGVEVEVRSSFGSETLPPGLYAVIGHKPA